VPCAALLLSLLAGCQEAPPATAPSNEQTPAAAARPKEPESPFVRVVQTDHGWFFKQGTNLFYSAAVDCVVPADWWPPDKPELAAKKALGSYDGMAQFGSDTQAWAVATVKRVEGWGFNSLGAWCADEIYTQGIYHTRCIWLSPPVPNEDRLIDVFTTNYVAAIDVVAARDITPHKDDLWLIGYFINNELPWYGEFGWPSDPSKSLLDRYSQLPADAPGRQELMKFLHENYTGFTALQADWETGAKSWADLEAGGALHARNMAAKRLRYAWAGRVADRYMAVCVDRVKAHDPNHLILGCRFAAKPPRAVVEAVGKYSDVISINLYSKSGEVDTGYLRDVYALTKKPVMITEFSWRAAQNRSGDANTAGADVTVDTQQERGDHYRSFVAALAAEPYLVGTHWFQYFDQPTAGRWFDGENSDYGILDIHDQPYEELVDAMKQTHAELPDIFQRRNDDLPAAFDAQAWAELLPVRVAPGHLENPVDFSPATSKLSVAAFEIQADAASGNSGSWSRDGDAWVLDYVSAGGWGMEGQFPLQDLDLAGTVEVEIEVQARAGLQLQVLLHETGDGPPGRQVYEGVNGADGESYELPRFTADGTRQVLRFRLADAERRVYWGNQGGNMTVDTQGLRAICLAIAPGQGQGQLRVYRIRFIGES
jgi:agarase